VREAARLPSLASVIGAAVSVLPGAAGLPRRIGNGE